MNKPRRAAPDVADATEITTPPVPAVQAQPKRPGGGGSFVRQPDGTLTRKD